MVARRISRSQLLGYLDKLSREEALPEPKLHQAADQFALDIDQLLANATRLHVRRDLVRYLGVNQDLLAQWQRMAEERHEVPRIDQSSLGNSHGSRVSGAMVTVRSARQPHPQVVMVNDQGEISAPLGSTPAARLVIVENLENFLSLDGTLSLLPTCGLSPAWQDADILYGSGNSITNILLTPFFQQYQEIGCLFDPDPGGIRMCDTLHQRGDLPPLYFLAPADLRERLSASTRELNMKQRQQLATHIRRSPPCAHVGGLIRTTGKHLEQETYLLPVSTTEATR
ncbi:hypothetical protein [Marinobacter sp. ATCH36]|uniref:hypothetical protein n=1 Tax=Marinobacter sp. ATCH36 TaxID=2945106 RepID=UPI002021B8AB|nr:hypothetical protein [Marinobacter sp. ATCH36]MCL7944022.1 hypothetical protein [Marinobacter sp. ATCH36]